MFVSIHPRNDLHVTLISQYVNNNTVSHCEELSQFRQEVKFVLKVFYNYFISVTEKINALDHKACTILTIIFMFTVTAHAKMIRTTNLNMT